MEINKNDKAKIDSVFHKAMEQHPDMNEAAAALWENGFGKTIAKQNFYRFGWGHYNVYTVAAISYTVISLVGILCFSTYYVVKKSNSSSSQLTPDNSITTDSIASNFSTEKGGQENQLQDQSDATVQSSSRRVVRGVETVIQNGISDSITVAPLKEEKTEIIQTTEEKQVIENVPATRKAPLVKIERRTVVIENQDTLEQVDTIRSKKEWKKLHKNK